MGKDKRTFTHLSSDKQTFYKELEERYKKDLDDILQIGGLASDLSRECWLAGFNYAFERIKKIFELKGGK